MDPVHARILGSRAARLRRLATQSPEPLAGAYRRRACELEFLSAVYGLEPAEVALSPVAA